MVDYIIRAANAPNWQRHKDAVLVISVGKEYHEGDKFACTIKWAAKHFERLHIVVADTLQRHNFKFTNARAHSLAEGSLWLARHFDELEETGKLSSVVRWNDLLTKKDFPCVLEQFHAAASTNRLLRESIDNDINRFLSRQQTILHDSTERSRRYLLEELAGFTLHARNQTGARIYPSKNLESFHVVEAGLIPEAPQGLEQQQRINLNTRRKKRISLQCLSNDKANDAAKELLPHKISA